MNRMRFFVISFVFLLICSLATKQVHAEEVISVKTPQSGQLKFIFDMPPNPIATVLLFAGGNGYLGLSGEGRNFKLGKSMKNNFLVRTRKNFMSQGFAIAVLDTPQQKRKMNAVYRMSDAHAGDIGAVVTAVNKRTSAPVWLVGTSMGTFSAPNGVKAHQGKVQGLVLTSSITRSPVNWSIHDSHPDGIINMELDSINVPVLITSHKDDGCDKTPAIDAAKLASAFSMAPVKEVKIFKGGSKPKSKPCQALSQHGYIGIEKEVVGAIADFIKQHSS